MVSGLGPNPNDPTKALVWKSLIFKDSNYLVSFGAMGHDIPFWKPVDTPKQSM